MKALKLILIVAAVALAPAIAWAAEGAGGGLADTEHDFSGLGTTTLTGLCTFCHTPHKASQTTLLWNHKLSTNNFTWDVPKTTAGTEFPTIVGDTYKGSTAKCLSCHDGTVAVGDLAWWDGAANPTAVGGKGALPAGDKHIITSGAGGASMKGNHPVAMPYPYGGVANTYNGKTTGSAFEATEWRTPPVLPVRLFNDDSSGNITAGAVAAKSGIECSSCHDPHNKQTEDMRFLRGTMGGNTTAYICLKCHIK
ncbi:MAG: hypothetical protein HYV93_24360 [Candidatus Rokubacteria bacterium]|nr:hypothetical protein [Candidatus Rokubacteria bacterium]